MSRVCAHLFDTPAYQRVIPLHEDGCQRAGPKWLPKGNLIGSAKGWLAEWLAMLFLHGSMLLKSRNGLNLIYELITK